MIILSTTTDNLQVVLGGNITTNQLQCSASFRDITTTTYAPDKSCVNTNNTTDVNLVAAPAASTQRVIDEVSIYNNDTANAVVTVKYDLNGTEYKIRVVTLGPGETLEYSEGDGWNVFTNAGAIKMSLNQGNNTTSSAFSVAVLGADVTNNNAVANTIADVTGLSFPVNSGTRYWFRFIIQYTAAATTTGSRWAINGPANTELRYRSEYSLTTTTRTLNDGVAGYDLPAASNATSAATTSNIAIIEGFILPSANGTVIARFASEVSSSAIIAKAGSIVQYMGVL